MKIIFIYCKLFIFFIKRNTCLHYYFFFDSYIYFIYKLQKNDVLINLLLILDSSSTTNESDSSLSDKSTYTVSLKHFCSTFLFKNEFYLKLAFRRKNTSLQNFYIKALSYKLLKLF